MRRAIVLVIASALRLMADHSAMHAYHNGTLQLECSTCHLPEHAGAVTLNPPGHEQCTKCHPAAFRQGRVRTLKEEAICSQCHSPTGTVQRDLSHVEFSHARHVDGLARTDPLTGRRADCTFCHKVAAGAALAGLPAHTECAACHAKTGMQPRLSADSKTVDCRGCHHPEQSPAQLATHYDDIRFSHAAHLRPHVDCPTCHAPVAASTHLASLELPKMLDCVPCHDSPHTLASQLRLSNCAGCHIQEKFEGQLPSSHNRNIRPPSHNQSFRMQHAAQASSPDAKCYACHLNVSPAAAVTDRCLGCHQMMRPVSHTARWKDDVHGKIAGVDRATCATCHTADSCVRCHNQTPRSHAPLALFKNGGHATLALVNERACLTCHTFQNTCASCHKRSLR